MAQPPGSQTVPLPASLPFRLVSKTIGQGAYASIRKAIPLNAPKPIIAVKFINKDHAFRQGRLTPKQLKKELTLHQYLKKHQNIIQFFNSGEDVAWVWIAMELAEGGDLFDKIEADAGVGEDVAHFYFTQLISAVTYMHSMGVAHRDIKPENILLSGEGNLKIADFGMAALFAMGDKRKLSTTVCGSPPYIAPEIVAGPRQSQTENLEKGYQADIADVWSCGVVLFVLLVGNTPWDEPTGNSPEFAEYAANNGRTSDELWDGIPSSALSLLRGILKLEPGNRFTLEEIRKHPWFTRPNALLSPSGTAANPIGLATQMLEALRIDFNADPAPAMRLRGQGQDSTRARATEDAMDIDMDGDDPNLDPMLRLASTQPETPIADNPFDWEVRPRLGSLSQAVPDTAGISASQPATTFTSPTNGSTSRPGTTNANGSVSRSSQLLDSLADDPSLSQFTATPTVPLTLTQMARRFRDIVPAHGLTRFVSAYAPTLLLPLLSDALHRLGVPVAPFALEQPAATGRAWTRLRAVDGRRQRLSGTIVVEVVSGEEEMAAMGGVVIREVVFIKSKGDPVEWRRLFKRVCVLCREAILVPS